MDRAHCFRLPRYFVAVAGKRGGFTSSRLYWVSGDVWPAAAAMRAGRPDRAPTRVQCNATKIIASMSPANTAMPVIMASSLSIAVCMSPLSRQGVTTWMRSCADTSIRTFATDLSCYQMVQQLGPLKPRSRAANGSMVDHSSIPAGENGLLLKMASSFDHLRNFIGERMRMSHIYQPVMIRELLLSYAAVEQR
jgi:hypothetical protein